MTSPATATGGTPASSNVFARFIGILTSPRSTFEKVVASPKWFGMLALCVVLAAVFSALPMTTDAGKQATIDKQVQSMQSLGFQVTDDVYDKMQQRSSSLPYTTAISVIVIFPIITVIAAGIFFAVFNAGMGGDASFRQVYATVIHAGVISTSATVFSGAINYFRHEMGSVANLGALLPMVSDKSFVGGLLGMIDVFTIWWVIVLAMGLAVLYRRRTQPIAFTLFGLYAVIAIGIALVKSRAGAA